MCLKLSVKTSVTSWHLNKNLKKVREDAMYICIRNVFQAKNSK